MPILPQGTILDQRYRITSLEAEGDIARIYSAQHLRLSRNVAIKMLTETAGRREVNRRRFDREARIGSRLGFHPNIAFTLDAGVHEDAPYLVHELVPGETLQNRLSRDGAFQLFHACNIMAELCSALSHMHFRTVVHRDLTLTNVMVRTHDAGEPWDANQPLIKVIDLGVGTLTSAPRITAPGRTVGTASFMSPEQALGNEVKPSSDLFSAGVIFYWLLTTHAPFQGRNTAEVLDAVLAGRVPPPSHYRAELSVETDAVVLKALRTDPKDRFSSAEEMREAILRLRPATDARHPIQSDVREIRGGGFESEDTKILNIK